MFGREAAEALQAGGEIDRRLGTVMSRALSSGMREEGAHHQIILLDLALGFLLDQPIMHEGPGAWTQGQRYSTSKALRGGATTTDQLANAEV